MVRIALSLLTVTFALPALAASEMWVTSDRLNRRTCPDIRCDIVGFLKFREKASVHEEKSGWARVTPYYDASCKDGRSEYVDSGNAACSEPNGIVDGQFAEWVSVQYLSAMRPVDPGIDATGSYALVSGSDDYRLYKDVFAKAASELIASGRCTEQDFKEMGGWWRSSNPSRPVYFIYCGEAKIDNRLYLDTSTGNVFK